MTADRSKEADDLRRRAEERLKSQASSAHARTADETQRLIHELQVHQIELEMQNEELRQSRAEVEVERERYADLYDFAPVGYFTLQQDGTIIEVNLTGARLLGSERAQLPGKRFGAHVAEGELPAFNAFLQRSFAAPAKQVCEVNLVANDLPPRTVQLDGALFSSRQSLRVAVVDITRLRQEEEERKRLMRQLFQARKMKALGVLAGGIAHDFNNLLAVILGNIHLSQMKLPADSKIAPYLSNAMTAIVRSRDLVTQILTFSRQKSPELEPVNLPLVIDETSRLLRATIPTSIDIQTDLPHNQVTINADSTQIQEVLINLCNNAVRAMNAQGELKIKLEPLKVGLTDIPIQYNVAPGHFARLSVRDSGAGIAPEVLEKIFDPFFTTKGVGEGNGMGLAVVHGIIESHAGFAKVRSYQGQGSTFEVYFPLITDSPKEDSVTDEDLPRGKERVLFVDDEQMLADIWSQLLAEYGYQVTTATSSQQALQLFSEQPQRFDLVITDQTMPELTGKELIEKLLSIRPELPTILCTGYSDLINQEDALALGVSAFLMKPLDISALSQAILKALDKDRP